MTPTPPSDDSGPGPSIGATVVLQDGSGWVTTIRHLSQRDYDEIVDALLKTLCIGAWESDIEWYDQLILPT